jgi:phosphotransferase system, enzyme I, PtsP
MDHLKLLVDFGELNWVSGSKDIQSFLNRIVSLVRRHMEADVCSIYLYDEAVQELVLEAAEGADGVPVGQLRRKLGEGLTGLALQELRPIRLREGRKHPAFKLVPGLDLFESYLCMPILRGIERIGVLTLQRKADRAFEESDERALHVIAAQLANIIENARLPALGRAVAQAGSAAARAAALARRGPIRCSAASEGCAAGPSFAYDRDRSLTRWVEGNLPPATRERFEAALDATEAQLVRLQAEVERTLDDAASLIFSSHLLILRDPGFAGEIGALVDRGEQPAKALVDVARKYMDIFARSPNLYVQEKVQDIKDIVIRILDNLAVAREPGADPLQGRLVIARELLPSDILRLASEKVAGIVLVGGGVTSHVSILVRSLRIPMLIADRPELLELPDGTPLHLDGDMGNLYVDPAADVAATLAGRLDAERRTARRAIRPETRTADGERVRLLTNINLLSDMKLAMQIGAEGVGLYRTEFPFLIRDDFPTEAEQYVIYRRIMEASGGKEVVFRTLDVGGDKALSHAGPREANPFLGLRSIRFSLANPDVFRQQVRAILRACAPAPAKIMFPMVSSQDELAAASRLVAECVKAVGSPAPILGTMIEIPSIVEIIEEVAREIDFFSIGTNDFVQYMLGVDRGNERVAGFYVPHHPSVLRALRRIVAAAHKAGKDVSVCGEMVHRRPYLAFLLGIGVRTLSMDAGYLPDVQDFIARLTIREAEDYAAVLLAAPSVEEAGNRLAYTEATSL